MALNFPGPFQLRIRFLTLSRVSTQRLNLDLTTDPGPGDVFGNYLVLRNGLAPLNLQAVLDAWVVLLQPIFSTGDTSIQSAELWKYIPESEDATFHAAADISAAGSHVGTAQPAGQAILSFISGTGGTMFAQFMQTAHAVGPTDFPPYAATGIQAISDFILSTGNWILAKDDGWPIATRKFNAGQNERLWKKINRA